jgi:hypothetical protein
MHALTDVSGEFGIGSLGRKTYSERRGSQGLDAGAVCPFADPLYHFAFDQTLQKPKARCLAQARTFDQLPQRHNLLGVKGL